MLARSKSAARADNSNVGCQYFSPAVDVAGGVPCNYMYAKETCQSGYCVTAQTFGHGRQTQHRPECDTGGDTAHCGNCKLMYVFDGLEDTCCSNCSLLFPGMCSPHAIDSLLLSYSSACSDGLHSIRPSLHLGLYKKLHDIHHKRGRLRLRDI